MQAKRRLRTLGKRYRIGINTWNVQLKSEVWKTPSVGVKRLRLDTPKVVGVKRGRSVEMKKNK